ncbi:histidine phosphatase family protein [Massilia atriviolacea]|uniref:Histidine phosphatase family protein n=2 Tax=Massilia atriviolacea TaxID=2495579 RepID=A0A430HRE9_9BURK|nr:histidine phosphatase family protein [Massilia atriviolacea]
MTFLACMAFPAARAADDQAFWGLLKEGGKVVLMRHAQTDAGIGDPPGFVLEQCGTQRNLSAQGRSRAVRTGARFRQHGVALAEVLSSRWCRCLDTARLAFGRVTPSAMLDSVFDQYAPSEAARTRELMTWLAARVRPGSRANVVLVTHAVNIEALAGVSLASGEMAVATLDGPRKLKVLARATPGS